MAITDEQVKAAKEAFNAYPEITIEELPNAWRAAIEAADAAAWSSDISKAPKDKMILADLGGGRVVLAYYSNWHYMLNPGWQSGEMGYVANEQIQKWRLAPTPPKELTK